jgi:hypothetical protein
MAIREVIDEKTGKIKPAIDATSHNLYDNIGKLKKNSNRKPNWKKPELKALRVAVAGKRLREINWNLVSQKIGRSVKACMGKASQKGYYLVNRQKRKTVQGVSVRKDGDSWTTVLALVKRGREIDVQLKALEKEREDICVKLKEVI